MKLFKDLVLKNKGNLDMVLNDAYKLDTYYMGMVDENNKVGLYDGKIRVVDYKGKKFVKFDHVDYTQHNAAPICLSVKKAA